VLLQAVQLPASGVHAALPTLLTLLSVLLLKLLLLLLPLITAGCTIPAAGAHAALLTLLTLLFMLLLLPLLPLLSTAGCAARCRWCTCCAFYVAHTSITAAAAPLHRRLYRPLPLVHMLCF
jgi:hypothetical protein